jgi:hypothetical protein
MDRWSLCFGETDPSLRVVRIAGIAIAAASLPIVLRVDTVLHGLRWYLSGGLVVLALGLAGYAGRNDGGIFGAWLVVFLSVLWLYVVPPLVAHLQGDGLGDREYGVLRPSAVRLDPYGELVTGLKYGPILALGAALAAGSAAFLLGRGTARFSPPGLSE